jgi:hypothetical protein
MVSSLSPALSYLANRVGLQVLESCVSESNALESDKSDTLNSSGGRLSIQSSVYI